MDKWHELKGPEAAQAVISTYEEIDKAVDTELEKHQSLKDLIYPPDADKNNVARSVMETATSYFGAIRPKPYTLTQRGDYTLKRRAKLLNQFSVGLASNIDLYSQTKKAFEDAWIYGDGSIQILDLHDDIGVEYVPSYEVRVDPVDGKYGDPQSIYRHKLINKSVLKAMFAGFDSEIDDAGVLQDLCPEHDEQKHDMEDACSVVMAWRRASGPEATDGHYSVSIKGAELDAGAWEDERLPIYRFSIGQRSDQYYSYGSVRIIAPLQQEIDTIHEKISGAYEEWCVKVSVTDNPKVQNNGWDGDAFFEIMEGNVNFIVPQLVSPDLIQYLQLMRQQAFELSGISEMSASSKKVPGVEAGVAIRELNDIQSVRFQSMNQDYEVFHLDIFKGFIRLAKRINKRPDVEGFKIMAESRDGIEMINWSDVELDDDKFQLQVWPASMFSGSPSAQLQKAQDLIAIAPQMSEYVLQAMDMPDIQSHMDRVNAPKNVIESIIEQIIDKGIYHGPQPFFDLQYCINEMLLAYNQAILNNIDPNRLDMMINWMSQADEILNPPPPPGMPQMPGPEAMPPVGPEGPAIGPEGMPPGVGPLPPNPAQAMPPQPPQPPPGPPPGV